MTATSITCPNCGHPFHAEQALEKQLAARLQREYAARAAEQARTLNTEKTALAAERERLVQQQATQESEFNKRLAAEAVRLGEAAQGRARERVAQELSVLHEQAAERDRENQALKRKELDFLRQAAELKTAQEQTRLQMEKQLLERQGEIETKARQQEQERQELRFREYEKQLNDQKKLIEQMKRKAEQGSMQLQGEVQELALEEMLTNLFPFDRIAPVAKGVRGADVVHTVVNGTQQPCGTIIYESKRTKAFSKDWIAKLKADQIDQGAELAVIVSAAMPDDLARFGQRDGVWICTFGELASLVAVLREMLLRTASVQVAQVNKGEKMELLYGYLTSHEFRQRVEAIVEGFSDLKHELDRERNAMQRIWKAREKQIDKIVLNTIDMYGAVKGIAGNSVATIPALELAPPAIDD